MRKITKEDFKFFNITDEQLKKAETIDNTKLELDAYNVETGGVGEIITSDFLKVPILDTYDYDMIKDGKRIDAKSKRVTSFDPDLYHYCDIYNCEQKTDYYIFSQISLDKRRGCILGWISKEEFFDKASFVKQFCKKPNDNYTAKKDLWCIRVSELHPFIYNRIEDTYSWDKYFMTLCYIIASRSKDESTKHGCVIVSKDNRVMATGYNSFPSGINDNIKERQSHVNGEKYFFIEHSERNAIYSASKYGIPLNGCKLYVQGTPCADCARAIIQSGITEVVIHKSWDILYKDLWLEHKKRSLEMFNEAGVTLTEWDGKLLELSAFFRGNKIEINNGCLVN